MSLTNFITAFYTKLNTLADRVFYGEFIDPSTKIPYVYFNNVDSIVDAIDGDGDINNPTGLNYYHYGSGSKPTFRCFRLTRLSIPTDDEIRVRKQLRYRVRVYL